MMNSLDENNILFSTGVGVDWAELFRFCSQTGIMPICERISWRVLVIMGLRPVNITSQNTEALQGLAKRRKIT